MRDKAGQRPTFLIFDLRFLIANGAQWLFRGLGGFRDREALCKKKPE